MQNNDISIEKEIFDSSYYMPGAHLHLSHELFFLLSGERRYFVGNKIFDVVPGNLVVIRRNELHRTTTPGDGSSERYVLYFNESSIKDFISSVGRETFDEFLASGCIQLMAEHSEMIHKSFEKIETEKIIDDSYSAEMIKNSLENIILCALRYGKRKHKENKEGADKIQEVARYISNNYSSEISLHDAANMAFMEETYFSKKFKTLTGFGFKEYLVMTRIKAAEELLMTTKLTINEISDLCGFSGSNYFGDVFKRFTGLSPSQYRKKHKI